MICGATGLECPYKPNESGEFPCGECETGIEFRKQWADQPTLHDE